MITDAYPERNLFHSCCVVSRTNASVPETILTGSLLSEFLSQPCHAGWVWVCVDWLVGTAKAVVAPASLESIT